MKRCPYCDRRLEFWWFKCPICARFVWRVPQILLMVVLIAAAIVGVIFFAEYFAARQNPIEPKPVQVPNNPRRR